MNIGKQAWIPLKPLLEVIKKKKPYLSLTPWISFDTFEYTKKAASPNIKPDKIFNPTSMKFRFWHNIALKKTYQNWLKQLI